MIDSAKSKAGPSPHLGAKCPERDCVHLRSKAGHVIVAMQVHQILVQKLHDTGRTGPARTDEEEEQLLYLALYRDKIAQHQAGLTPAAPSRRRRQGDDRIPAAASADLRGVPGPGPSAADLADGAPSPPRGPSPRQSAGAVGSGGGSAAVAAAQQHTHHIASVVALPADGGISAEHQAMKHLGNLFDEWFKEQDGVMPTRPGQAQAPATAAGHAGGHASSHGAPTAASPSRARAQVASPSPPRPPTASSPSRAQAKAGRQRQLRLGARGRAPGAAAPGAALGVGAGGAEGGAAAIGEVAVEAEAGAASPSQAPRSPGILPPRSFARGERVAVSGQGILGGYTASVIDPDCMGRVQVVEEEVRTARSVSALFNVITNPKSYLTEQACFGAAHGVRREPRRDDVGHIESVPHLKVGRLYEGPWRMNI